MLAVENWTHWFVGMKTFRGALCLGVLAFALSSAGTASAACLIPVGPTQTSKDGVTSLHSYGEGVRLCIHAFGQANSCDNCETGYWHMCTNGYWAPTTLSCEAKDAIKPVNTGSAQPQNPPPTGRHQPDQKLCKILGTC